MPDFTYDPTTGELTITIEPLVTGNVLKSTAKANFMWTYETLRVAVEKAVKNLSIKTEAPTIRIPYYQQVGPSCWAADVAMLAKAYGKPKKIHELLKALDRPDASTGWGLGPTSFNNPMRPKVEAETGLALKYELYWSQENLRNRIIALLDKGYPVMLGLPTRVLAWRAAIRWSSSATVRPARGPRRYTLSRSWTPRARSRRTVGTAACTSAAPGNGSSCGFST